MDAMTKNIKRFFALILTVAMLLPTLAGCQTGGAGETTAPEVTEPKGEAEVLKVLTIGHSLAVDSGHMLALIANAEGYEHMTVATLYYSGCPLYKHVKYLTENAPEYNLYLSSTETPNKIPEIMQGVTMEQALRQEYWDIIVMQGGVFELVEDKTFKDGNIQIIQKYVNENKLNPNAIFAWHMPWATPTNNDLRDMYPNKENNTYYSNYEKLGHNRTNYYNGITKCVKDHIVTDETFEILIPSGTAIENALSSYLEETDLHRDYAHASDLGRVIASYTWYCSLVGIDHLDEIKLNTIPKHFFKSLKEPTDHVLTDMEKAIVLESVNNALKNPLQMTQSQYTEAPAA